MKKKLPEKPIEPTVSQPDCDGPYIFVHQGGCLDGKIHISENIGAHGRQSAFVNDDRVIIYHIYEYTDFVELPGGLTYVQAKFRGMQDSDEKWIYDQKSP